MLTKEQEETLGLLDAVIAMLEKNPKSNLEFNISVNPMDFLLNILTKFCTQEEIIDWLANMVVKVLPYVELAVKGLILSKLKSDIDCGSDPRIPDWMRKNCDGGVWYIDDELEKQKGLIVNLNAIDYKNIMNISPFSDSGKNYYFGINKFYCIDGSDEKYSNYKSALNAVIKANRNASCISEYSECSNVYKLARANDFNAFLWFTVNKGYFPTGYDINDLDKIYKSKTRTIFNVIDEEETIDENNPTPTIGIGNFVKGGSNVALCIDSETIPNGEKEHASVGSANEDILASNIRPSTYRYTIVPLSSDNKSCNWYADRKHYYDFLHKESNRKERNYANEFPICNVRYVGREASSDRTFFNSIRFTILPKPFCQVPLGEDKPWNVRRFTFNENGEQDIKGRYSVSVNRLAEVEKDYIYKYSLLDPYSGKDISGVKLIYNKLRRRVLF